MGFPFSWSSMWIRGHLLWGRFIAIAAWLVLSFSAKAEIYARTNNIAVITNASEALVFNRTSSARLSVWARQNVSALPLSLTGNYDVKWYWTDPRDGIEVAAFQGRVENATNGHVMASAFLNNLDSYTNYQCELWVLLNTVKVHRVAWHVGAITQAVAAAGDVSVNIITTGEVSVVTEGAGNVVTQVLESGDSEITVRYGEVTGGGSGSTILAYTNGTLLGEITNGISIDGTMSGYIAGGTFYMGFNVNSPIPTNLIGSNRVSFTYTGLTNTFSVPAGVTNLMIWAWGGASFQSVSAGGFSQAMLPVTPFENLTVVVGRGSAGSTNRWPDLYVSDRAFPNGGRGVVASGNPQGGSGGAGSSHVLRGTNVVVVAGGAGGHGSYNVGAAYSGGLGGGLIGGDGLYIAAAVAGEGGGQFDGGYSPTNDFENWMWTNTPGAFMAGGDGGVTNASANGYIAAGGGGGGLIGGGGGYCPIIGKAAGGGGGSGYVNPSLCYWGITLQGSGQYPAGMELNEYIAGVGVGVVKSSWIGVEYSNNGLVVIGY